MGLDAPKMNPFDALIAAKDQFILSQYTSLAYCFGLGRIDIRPSAIYLGPYHIDLNGVDFIRGAWSAEKIATQNLAISLDTYLEVTLGNQRLKGGEHVDYCQYVRCLRNAFTHNPYSPKWVLTDTKYRKCFHVTNEWTCCLKDRHNTDVVESDYKYASGLLHLVKTGIEIVHLVEDNQV